MGCVGAVLGDVFVSADYEGVNLVGSLGLVGVVRRVVRRLLAVLGVVRVLDVGSGFGPLHGYLPLGAWVVSLDPALPGLVRAHLAGFDAVVGVAEFLPFRSSAFDSVVSVFALRLFRLVGALPEVFRVSRRFVVLLDLWRPRSVLLVLLLVLFMFLVYLPVAAVFAPRVWARYLLVPRSFLGSPGEDWLVSVVRVFAGRVLVRRLFLGFLLLVAFR